GRWGRTPCPRRVPRPRGRGRASLEWRGAAGGAARSPCREARPLARFGPAFRKIHVRFRRAGRWVARYGGETSQPAEDSMRHISCAVLVVAARAEQWRPWRAYAALHLGLKTAEL